MSKEGGWWAYFKSFGHEIKKAVLERQKIQKENTRELLIKRAADHVLKKHVSNLAISCLA